MPNENDPDPKTGADQNQPQRTDPWHLQRLVLGLKFAKPVEPKQTRPKDALGRAKRPPRDETRFVAKGVLLALAIKADAAGQCWAYVSTLAREVETTSRTVQRYLAALERAGFLSREPFPKGEWRQGAQNFILHFERWDQELVAAFHRELEAERNHSESPPPDSIESGAGDSIESGGRDTIGSGGGDSDESPGTTSGNSSAEQSSSNVLSKDQQHGRNGKKRREKRKHPKRPPPQPRSPTADDSNFSEITRPSKVQEGSDSIESPARDPIQAVA